MVDELVRLDAQACARAILQGDITASDLVSACLAHIDEREGAVEAWQHLERDVVDRQLSVLDTMTTDTRGPLHGVPVGIKDIYDTFDMPTAYGSEIYAGNRPPWDAAAVARLRAAGAVILGKTVTTEFAYWKAGKTRNPHDTTRTPGGSSSGSAAAVADFMVPLAIGSQTVASTVRPASYCGVVGFKPSYGRISLTGVKSLASSLDTAGVFARTVSDAALIASIMAGRSDWTAAASSPDALTVRVARTPDWDEVTADAMTAFEMTVSLLRSAGADVSDTDAPGRFKPLSTVQNTILAFEAAREFSSEWLHHRARLSPEISELIEEGNAITPEQFEDAVTARRGASEAIEELFAGADVLLAPSTLGEAPLIEEGTGNPLMSRAWTLLGLPSISLPCGKGPAGMPLGLQIAARPGRDGELISDAKWIEARLA
ncbi:MAG: amidase [Hyphomicrobiaceae bacterium]|nr:amidase [Hyphomicrobiaceae bacterium]